MFPASQLFLYLTQPEPVTQPLTMFPEPQPFIYLTQPVTQHLTMFPESQLFIYLTQPVTRSTLDNVSRVTTVYLLDSTCNSTFDNVFKVTTVYLLDSSCDNVSMMTTVCLPDDSPFATNSTATPVSCDTDTHANGFPVVTWFGVCDCRREASGEMKVDVFTSHSPHRHTSAKTDSGRVQRCLTGRMYEAGRWGKCIHNQQ